jgi:hypothetical protein
LGVNPFQAVSVEDQESLLQFPVAREAWVRSDSCELPLPDEILRAYYCLPIDSPDLGTSRAVSCFGSRAASVRGGVPAVDVRAQNRVREA